MSPLREDNAERTRERILEGLIRVLAKGPAELSVPAVARQAGVSVPTVYRHFGSKRGLTDALYDHYTKRIAADFTDAEDVTIDSFLERVDDVFQRQADVEPVLREAMSSSFSHTLRREQMPKRIAGIKLALARSGVESDDLDKLATVLTILTSSAIRSAFSDYFELGPDEAAEHVTWAIRHLLRSVGAKPKGRGRR